MRTILWFTGLSGSGKTTVALALKEQLEVRGKTVGMLDGDTIRNTHEKKLGFTREDIKENNRRIAEYMSTVVPQFDFVLVPVIAPYTEYRATTRAQLGTDYYEIYVDCPVEVCAERDVKGLYKKARSGQIPFFTGIDSPYDAPEAPELVVNTSEQSLEDSVQAVIQLLKARGVIQS